jgi:hypothetical protein
MTSRRPGRCGERREGRGDLVGIVGEVVDHGDAAAVPTVSSRRFSPAKRPSASAASARGHAQRMNGSEGGQRVAGIVAARQGQPHSAVLPPAER